MQRLAVVLFWIVAAAVVVFTQTWLVPRSLFVGSLAASLAIFATAYGYTRYCARFAGASHALGVGIVWLLLAVLTEMAFEAVLGTSWNALLVSPSHPLLRNIFLLLWVFAPVVFAHSEDQPA